MACAARAVRAARRRALSRGLALRAAVAAKALAPECTRQHNLACPCTCPLRVTQPANQPLIAYSQADDAFTVNTHIIPNRVITSTGLGQGGILIALSGK